MHPVSGRYTMFFILSDVGQYQCLVDDQPITGAVWAVFDGPPRTTPGR